jgi:hypothetical protein
MSLADPVEGEMVATGWGYWMIVLIGSLVTGVIVARWPHLLKYWNSSTDPS